MSMPLSILSIVDVLDSGSKHIYICADANSATSTGSRHCVYTRRNVPAVSVDTEMELHTSIARVSWCWVLPVVPCLPSRSRHEVEVVGVSNMGKSFDNMCLRWRWGAVYPRAWRCDVYVGVVEGIEVNEDGDGDDENRMNRKKTIEL